MACHTVCKEDDGCWLEGRSIRECRVGAAWLSCSSLRLLLARLLLRQRCSTPPSTRQATAQCSHLTLRSGFRNHRVCQQVIHRCWILTCCMCLQVVVQGLPWKYTWKELKPLFEDCGPIARADVMFGRDGRSRVTTGVGNLHAPVSIECAL